MTLYTCSESEKEKWIAELDLNPETTGRIAVCSLHFKNGEPTEECPLPTELLSDREEKPLKFKGNYKLESVDEVKEQQKSEYKSCDRNVNTVNRENVSDLHKPTIFTQL